MGKMGHKDLNYVLGAGRGVYLIGSLNKAAKTEWV